MRFYLSLLTFCLLATFVICQLREQEQLKNPRIEKREDTQPEKSSAAVEEAKEQPRGSGIHELFVRVEKRRAASDQEQKKLSKRDVGRFHELFIRVNKRDVDENVKEQTAEVPGHFRKAEIT